MKKIKALIRNFFILILFDIPYLVAFVVNQSSKGHAVGFFKKIFLAIKVLYNNYKIESLSAYYQHLYIITEILNISPDVDGDAVECGSYKGASSANLSLACALTNRTLYVCDSFEGLPKPKNDEKYDIRSDTGSLHEWKEGEMSTADGLEGIKRTIKKYGNISVCKFVKGYFKDSLSTIESENFICIFEDAVLESSVRDCLYHLWPKLENNCKFFCHEPWSKQVVSLFYDERWWEKEMGTDYPGFFGSGHGIRLGLRYLKMGYAIKTEKPIDDIKK